MRRRHALTAATATFMLLVAACGDDDGGSDAPAGASTATVDIADFSFGPETVTVAPGAEITFVNADDAAHTATARDDSFNTDSIDGGSSASVTAPSEAGTYEYFCAFHPTMVATVTVS